MSKTPLDLNPVSDINQLVGTTVQRPTSGNFIGRRYFDTSYGRPIWCAQVVPIVIWVFADGSQHPTLVDSNASQSDALSVRLTVHMIDHNSAQADALAVEVEEPSLDDDNLAQTDAILVKIKPRLLDSNSNQADAVTVKVKAGLADSNANQTDAVAVKVKPRLLDTNSNQADAIVVKVKASLADSNANQTDSLLVTVTPTFPPAGAVMAWRADSGVVEGTPPAVNSWTDSVANKLATATSQNFNASEASFNNQPGIDSAASGSDFFVNTSPAIAEPYWIWGVLLPGVSSLSQALNTGFNSGNQFQVSLGGGASGTISLVSNSNSLSASFDATKAAAFAIRVGGAGQVSKIYIDGVLKISSPSGQFTDAVMGANNGFFIGNRNFLDHPMRTICEFGFSNDTFSPSAYETYTSARYGV